MNDSLIQREIHQLRPFKSRSQELLVSILRTADMLRHAASSVIEHEGITLQQYNVLRILRGVSPDPLPTLVIGERLIERTPGVTRLLDRLEHKNLVFRERCVHDRRRVLCRITTAGLAMLDRLEAAVDAVDESAFTNLAAADKDRLVALLDVVRQGLHA